MKPTMQKIEICDCQWADVLAKKKTNLCYSGKKEFNLCSHILVPKIGEDMRVVRITKVLYNEEKNLTTVDFEL